MTPFHRCPHCRSVRFYPGPRGGSSQNVTCVDCTARFSLVIPPLPGPLLLLEELRGPAVRPTDPSDTVAGYVIELFFTCPICRAISHNPNDASHRYCARCHKYVDDEV
jgi:hypothetical protein